MSGGMGEPPIIVLFKSQRSASGKQVLIFVPISALCPCFRAVEDIALPTLIVKVWQILTRSSASLSNAQHFDVTNRTES